MKSSVVQGMYNVNDVRACRGGEGGISLKSSVVQGMYNLNDVRACRGRHCPLCIVTISDRLSNNGAK